MSSLVAVDGVKGDDGSWRSESAAKGLEEGRSRPDIDVR